MKIDECIGNNIRKYRIAYNMTLKELAVRIHKSISTVSKYEKGTISLDMATLAEIACIFQASPSMLLHSADKLPDAERTYKSSEILYMYTYDSPKKCIVQSVIERYPSVEQNNAYKINLFNDVCDTKNPGKCGGLYTGECTKNGFIETYMLHNQIAELEYVLISCVDNLVNPNQQLGLVSGLSNYTMFPVTFKTIISGSELTNKERLEKELQFSRDDFKAMKRNQCLTILNTGEHL